MAFMVDLQTSEHRHDLHAVRRVLETEAAARAALYITDEQLDAAAKMLGDIEPLVLAGGELDLETILDADVAFHHIVAQGSNNSALAALIDALANRTSRARLWLGLHNQGQVRNSHAEHVAILKALRARQPDRARLLMDHHLLIVEDSLQDQAADEST
jgi:DNA-binding GntR family transcriptional regulator